MNGNRWMDIYIIYIHNGMLFSLKIEENLANCNNMNETGGRHVKWIKPDKEKQIYDLIYTWNLKRKTKFIATEKFLVIR